MLNTKSAYLSLATIAFFSALVGCATKPAPNRYESPENRPLVDEKYSLAADRSKLEELRKEIPQEIKNKNDQEAVIKHLVQEVKRPPHEIRSIFAEMVSKKRQEFDRDMTKEREKFNSEEKVRRDGFLDKQTSARESFNRGKKTKQERDTFFSDQDKSRKTFFADEREKRNDFESQVRERRKNFEDHIRSKSNEFNSELREYQKKYDDMKKAEAEAKRQAEKERLEGQKSKAPPSANGQSGGTTGKSQPGETGQ